MGKLADSLLISVWNSKPIWSLNLNFDDGDMGQLGLMESTRTETEQKSLRKEKLEYCNNDWIECAIVSIWNSKYIWSLNLNFDNIETQRPNNDKREEN